MVPNVRPTQTTYEPEELRMSVRLGPRILHKSVRPMTITERRTLRPSSMSIPCIQTNYAIYDCYNKPWSVQIKAEHQTDNDGQWHTLGFTRV